MNHDFIVAGPCAAESEHQVLSTARQLSSIGIKYFRAGVWKPRTQPGCFEGVGAEALDWLVSVKKETGMSVGTEIATPEHAHLANENGLDFVWIGARTTSSPFALQEIIDVLKEKDLLIMIKNPINPDINLWIGAIQRFRMAGFNNLVLVHRGFSVYNSFIYRNAPHWYIPIEMHRQFPEIPMLCDPSHISGKRELVPQLCQEALDLAFDGLFIESHISPDMALSDAAQQLTPCALKNVLDSLVVHNNGDNIQALAGLRSQIDTLDADLIETLYKRMQVSVQIGEYKYKHNMPIVQKERYSELIIDRINMAKSLGLSSDFIKKMYELIHEESVNKQLRF